MTTRGGTSSALANPHDAALLCAVRAALARPFVDPVAVLDLPLSRRAARALERELSACRCRTEFRDA